MKIIIKYQKHIWARGVLRAYVSMYVQLWHSGNERNLEIHRHKHSETFWELNCSRFGSVMRRFSSADDVRMLLPASIKQSGVSRLLWKNKSKLKWAPPRACRPIRKNGHTWLFNWGETTLLWSWGSESDSYPSEIRTMNSESTWAHCAR